MKNVVVIICFLFLVSCKNNKTKSQDSSHDKVGIDTTILYKFDFEGNIKDNIKADTICINDIAKKIEFTTLDDSRRESLLSNLKFTLHKINDKYIVSSSSSGLMHTGLMQFDSLGNFDKLLIDKGQSNREVPGRLYTWTVNEDLNQLTASCGYRFISYSYLDKTIKGIPLERYYYGIILLNDSSYVGLPNVFCSELKEDPYLVFLNAKGKPIKLKHYKKERDIYYDIPTSYNGPLESYGLSANYDGSAMFRDMFNDTIYRISAKDDIKPYILFDRGKLTPKVKDVNNKSKKDETIYIKNVAETEQYILVKYAYQAAIICAIWSKSSKQMIINTSLDLDGNTPLINCRYFFNYMTANNEKIVVGIESITKNKLYGYVMSKDAMRFLPGVSEDSNPVVMEICLDIK